MEEKEFNIKLIENQIKEFTKNLLDTFSVYELTKEEIEIDFRDIEFEINYYCFITSSFLDLQVIMKGYNLSKTSWEKVFYVKNGYLIIYETIETYNKLNKENLELINKKYSSLKTKHKEISNTLKNFKKEFDYENFMSKTRNYIGAHRDPNFSNSFEILLSFKTKRNIEAIQAFLKILYEIMELSFEMANSEEEKITNKGKS